MANELALKYFYKNDHPKRGKAVIFNHYQFDIHDLKKREGTKKDAKDLKLALKKFNFDVIVHDDLTLGKIVETLEKLAKEDHGKSDCLLIAVMTHGKNGALYARNHQYPVDYLWKQFTGKNCPTLVGKPKIFLIQACRGDDYDKGVSVKSSNVEYDGIRQDPSYKIPDMADFLIMYSTFQGYRSWRTEEGTWFIQAVCETLQSKDLDKTNLDLVTLLTIANHNIASKETKNSHEVEGGGNPFKNQSDATKHEAEDEEEEQKMKQVGTIVSTLTRMFVLVPKKYQTVYNKIKN